MRWFGIMMLATMLAVVPASASAQQQGKGSPSKAPQTKAPEAKGPQAPPAAKSFTPQEREDYEKKTDAALADLQMKISDLRAKANAAAPNVKKMYTRNVMSLQKMAGVARNKFTALQKASKEEWQKLKKEMEEIMKQLSKVYEGAASRF